MNQEVCQRILLGLFVAAAAAVSAMGAEPPEHVFRRERRPATSLHLWTNLSWATGANRWSRRTR